MSSSCIEGATHSDSSSPAMSHDESFLVVSMLTLAIDGMMHTTSLEVVER